MDHVLCGYHLALARPKRGVLDGAFLVEALGSRALRRELSRIANGTTRFGLTLNSTRSILMKLPPLAEQQAIASILGSIDRAIKVTEAVIASAKDVQQTLSHELLTQGVPGWHQEWRELSSWGTVPADWGTARLGDLTEINRRRWNPSDGSLILYLDLASIVSPGCIATPREIRSMDAPSRARRRVGPGDILVSTVRPNLRSFARIVHAPRNLVASTGFAVLTPLTTVSGSFVYHHIMAQRFADYLDQASTGTGLSGGPSC